MFKWKNTSNIHIIIHPEYKFLYPSRRIPSDLDMVNMFDINTELHWSWRHELMFFCQTASPHCCFLLFFFFRLPPQTWNLSSNCPSAQSTWGLNNLQTSSLFSACSRIQTTDLQSSNQPSKCFKLPGKSVSRKLFLDRQASHFFSS